MYGLAVNLTMSVSGHPSIFNEIYQKKMLEYENLYSWKTHNQIVRKISHGVCVFLIKRFFRPRHIKEGGKPISG